ILAGDYLKEASDRNANMIGIGLLYKNGYFIQRLTAAGEQLAYYEPQNFSKMPLHAVRNEDGTWKKVHLAFPGRSLYARIWRVDVGRIPLYLLDADFIDNEEKDKSITFQLYGGDWENRLKQELLLGVGGIRALQEIDFAADLYHCNEGHAAFISIERLRQIIERENLSFQEASEIVRSSTLFTTHTPVPAGHDAFEEDILRTYIPHYADRLNISWHEFMGLGRMNPDNPNEKFSMSHLAARLSLGMNGVSRIHGRVSQDMFKDLWKGYFAEELHITYVTNGVHYPTWAAPRWRKLYEETFGGDFLENQSKPEIWNKIYDVPDATIWDIRNAQRKDMIKYVKDRTHETWTVRQENPRKITGVLAALRDDVLTFGFARRFASYKRAHLLFRDLERLAKIVNNPDKPVLFLFAGKAHPNDKPGQDLIKFINDITNRPEFNGKVLFIENYDIDLAKKLVQGVDVWINTPTRPLEASGTSGEKAIMNGIMNLSVLDGWWAEGYVEKAGWALEEQRTYNNQEFQNELDAVNIYNIIESEVVPLFYKRDANGIPVGWVQWIKNNISQIAPHFTMSRMLRDYQQKFYGSLSQRAEAMLAKDHLMAKQLASWKKRVSRAWESIEVIEVSATDTSTKTMDQGDMFEARVLIDLKELSVDDVGVEIIFVDSGHDINVINHIQEMEISHVYEKTVTYTTRIPTRNSGIYNYSFRIYPKNKLLAHRQDFNLLKWF
ncbi:MAG: alpha-glucan family phosphorylase, partial [Bacteroidetes bacterium]|nr:alpha-glucan family phosphorylase [Bacteroidota bacterium]